MRPPFKQWTAGGRSWHECWPARGLDIAARLKSRSVPPIMAKFFMTSAD
jgi:hypothetical protein